MAMIRFSILSEQKIIQIYTRHFEIHLVLIQILKNKQKANNTLFFLMVLLFVNSNTLLYSQTFHRAENIVGLSILQQNNGAAVADYEGDLDLDIFIVAKLKDSEFKEFSKSRLFRNNSNGTFTDLFNFNSYTSKLEDFIPIENIKDSREKTLSYAAYRLLSHRFKESPSSVESLKLFNYLMNELGYDVNEESVDYSGGNAAALGNYIASTIIDYGNTDGSREQFDYRNLGGLKRAAMV